MSYKEYKHSLKFVDCPYDADIAKEVEALIAKIESRDGTFKVSYELDVEWKDTDASTKKKEASGLTDDESKYLDAIEQHCLNTIRKNEKGKIKHEVEVEKEV